MINWGVIGLGNMSYKFINAIKEIENAKIVSVASLSKKKTDNLIKSMTQHGCPSNSIDRESDLQLLTKYTHL